MDNLKPLQKPPRILKLVSNPTDHDPIEGSYDALIYKIEEFELMDDGWEWLVSSVIQDLIKSKLQYIAWRDETY